MTPKQLELENDVNKTSVESKENSVPTNEEQSELQILDQTQINHEGSDQAINGNAQRELKKDCSVENDLNERKEKSEAISPDSKKADDAKIEKV